MTLEEALRELGLEIGRGHKRGYYLKLVEDYYDEIEEMRTRGYSMDNISKALGHIVGRKISPQTLSQNIEKYKSLKEESK